MSPIIDRRIGPILDWGVATFNDSSEFTMTAPNHPDGSTHPLAGAGYCRGFHTNVDGDIYLHAPGQSTEIKLTIKEGNYYPYGVGKFRVTNTSAALLVANAVMAGR